MARIENISNRKYFLISALASTLLIFVSFFLWEAIHSYQNDKIKKDIGDQRNLITQSIKDNFDNTILALRRMGSRWEVSGGTPEKQWLADAKNHVNDQLPLTAVEFVNRDYIIERIYPLLGNEEALGLNIAFDEKRREFLKGAEQKDVITLSPPIDLVQGYRAVILYVPIYIGENFKGFIVGVFNTETLLGDLLSSVSQNEFIIEILDSDSLLHTFGSGIKSDNSLIKEMNILNRKWNIHITATKEHVEKLRTRMPDIVLFSGVILSILSGLITYYLLISAKLNRLLNLKNIEVIRNEKQLKAIIDNAVDGLIVIDSKGIIQSSNPACEAIFGYSSSEVIGKNVSVLMLEPDRSNHDGYIKNYHNTGKKKIIGIGREVKGRRKNGEEFLMHLSISEIEFEGERFYNGIVRDLTDKERLIKKLKDSNEQLSTFAYICSHDLQEPLRTINTFSEKLEEHIGDNLKGDEKGSKYFEFIKSSSKRARELVRDILEYSKIDSDDEGSELVDIKEIIAEIKDSLGSKLEECEGEINHGELPEIFGNKTQIYQLFSNIIGNGIKYQPKGAKPVIDISVDDEGNHYKFKISDNGIGIAKEHQDKIFEVFRRLHGREEYSGTGIGLAICKKVVEKHQGKIWIESTEGKGTDFYFTLIKKRS